KVVDADVLLGRAQRDAAEGRIAPPGVAPLALLVERDVVVARDAGAGEQRHGALTQRLRQRREGNHAPLLPCGPRLHDLTGGEIDESIGVDRHAIILRSLAAGPRGARRLATAPLHRMAP